MNKSTRQKEEVLDSVKTPQTDVTALLYEAGRGDQRAVNDLFERVYTELRKLAGDYLRRESRSTEHTLQATALVHEAYLRLVGQRTISRQNVRGISGELIAENPVPEDKRISDLAEQLLSEL